MLDDFFPGIDLRWDDKGASGWIKRNAADLLHWCTILGAIGFVTWTAVVLGLGFFFGASDPGAVQPEAVPDTLGYEPYSAGEAPGVEQEGPPWWWTAFLDTIKAVTPLALPFVTNYARKKFRIEDE